jgi:hypothetical protein
VATSIALIVCRRFSACSNTIPRRFSRSKRAGTAVRRGGARHLGHIIVQPLSARGGEGAALIALWPLTSGRYLRRRGMPLKPSPNLGQQPGHRVTLGSLGRPPRAPLSALLGPDRTDTGPGRHNAEAPA